MAKYFNTVSEVVRDTVEIIEEQCILPAEFREELTDELRRMLKRFGVNELSELDDVQLKEVKDYIKARVKKVVLADPFTALNISCGSRRLGEKIGFFSGMGSVAFVVASFAMITAVANSR